MAKDFRGQRFGLLTAVERGGLSKDGRIVWKFICDCGTYVIRKPNDVRKSLKSGVQSCGCKKQGPNRKHGFFGTRFYRIWSGMKVRCFNKKVSYYARYGGSGITVCDRWMNFVSFKEDMYGSYLQHVEMYGEKNTTLDRIDGGSDYSRENCRWATYLQQNNNRRVWTKGLPTKLGV